MRRILWLALLAVMTFLTGITGAAPSRLASYQQPGADATDGANRAPAQTGERSSTKIWTGRYQEFEEFLRTSEIERTTTVSTGVLGIKRAYFKPGGLAGSAALRSIRPGRYDGFWESYKGDLAAYKLDRLLDLDMVPPTVERRYNGEMVSMQLWVQGTKMLSEVQKQNLRPPDPEPYSFQLRRQKVFQNLAGNIDPNQGNILFDPAWNVILVDFSRAFTNTQALPFEATSIDRLFIDRIKALNRETLRREIGDSVVEGGAVDAILARRDLIVKAFDRLAKLKGPSQVFLP
jgi:hypothetical protein